MDEDKSILMEIKKMFQIIKRNGYGFLNEMKEVDLTPVQFMILGYISEHSNEEIYQRDIEMAFNIRRSTVTNLIKAIEGKGYIKRETVESDARLKRLVLTVKSKDIDKNVRREMNEIDTKMKNGLTSKELDIFFNVIDKINKNMGGQ